MSMTNEQIQALKEKAECICGILENIAGYEPGDIDGDDVELRFETEDGFDTGCTVSIVEQCQSAADIIRSLLAERDADKALIAELEKKHCGGSLMEREEHHVGVVNKLLERITELEARTLTVKLPKPHAHLIWIQAGYPPDDYWDDVAVSHSVKDRCCDGSERYPVYSIFEIQEACTAVGITLVVGE